MKQKIVLGAGILLCVIPLLFAKVGFSLFVVAGVGFYTLQEVGYLVDVYLRKTHAERNPIHYALYIAFFPKFVSGPIETSDHFLRQINEVHDIGFDYDRVKSGMLLVLWGYVQKTLIADSLSVYVSKVYENWQAYSGAMIILSSILFAFQLYADFAGYTNIVLGSAQMFGYILKENFRQPYLAVSIKDFWRRWHISLSTWLREYIYIPLGGNRKGRFGKCINLLLTFMISGLWHGISFGYLAWGMLHGIYLIIEEFVKGKRNHIFLRRVGVFAQVTFAWMFFRASGLKSALGMLYSIFFRFSLSTLSTDVFQSLGLGWWEILMMICGIGGLIFVDTLHERQIHIRELIKVQPVVVRWSFYLLVVFVITIMQIRQCGIPASNFIYSQF